MSFEVRLAKPEEFDRVVELDTSIFNYQLEESQLPLVRDFLEPDRLFVLTEAGEIVGVSSNLSLELTVPGGATLPMTGVTWVGVLPTHHRRGGLSTMMKTLLEDGASRAEPIAGLYASESVIYRRFGFGTASRATSTSIEVRRAQLRQEHQPVGTVHIVDKAQAVEALTEVAEKYRRTRNGMVSRPHKVVAHDLASTWHIKNPHFAVHRDPQGRLDGFIRYTIGESFEWLPNAEVSVSELWGLTPEVEIDLWMYALQMDFAGSVVGKNRPIDEPIADLLMDPRRWVTAPRDALHVRIADVETALSARRYACSGELTIEVVDQSGGRATYQLTSAGNDVRCQRTEAKPEVSLDLPSLGAIYLGDSPVERLHRAGLVTELSDGAVRRATTMFSWSPLPWSGYVF